MILREAIDKQVKTEKRKDKTHDFISKTLKKSKIILGLETLDEKFTRIIEEETLYTETFIANGVLIDQRFIEGGLIPSGTALLKMHDVYKSTFKIGDKVITTENVSIYKKTKGMIGYNFKLLMKRRVTKDNQSREGILDCITY